MGRVLAPYGVKGWVKIETFGDDPSGLAAHKTWWLGKAGQWQKAEVAQIASSSGDRLIARLEGCVERDAAQRLKGCEIALEREQLPPSAANEYYWVDLVGLKVVNEKAEDLGVIAEIFDNGAHAIMRVVDGEIERLLPFVGQVVREVDRAGGRVRVDWGSDW